MNRKQFLERVLGAILVFAFGFIVYSAFLDSSGSVYVDRSTQIPARSGFIEPLDVQTLDNERARIGAHAPGRPPGELFIPRRQVTAEDALGAGITGNGMPNAWVIQVGSFSSRERADDIRDQLIGKSYKAYHRKLDADKSESELYRVLLGPYMNAEQAVRHQREVDQMLELSTLLMRFEP